MTRADVWTAARHPVLIRLGGHRRVPPPGRGCLRPFGQDRSPVLAEVHVNSVRRDGLGNLVTWQLGPVRHTLDQPTESTLIDLSEPRTVAARLLYVHDTEFEWHDPDGLSPSPVAAAHGALVADPGRSEQIVADVVDALRRGRNCLVLTRRLAHLDNLASRLRARGKDPMILQGGMSAADRRTVVERLEEARAGEGLLVVGTTPYIGEGFDAPLLDTLFLTAPISFEGLLVQCAGRVVRAAPGKTTAEVHDYHDVAVPILASSLQRRMPGYRTLGFSRKT